ncbi:DeoR/GlpR family DNA-binding transcription regulator [Propionicicella superfundia]|uniref:DeoR/GlpR family DNA-binding transcription regulator n=1 Tax=Propionicicella superfundia TaxID=348582 RepID=UPI00048CD665|nr:DeoR/GlpR family DNA-binding transcription regulator [Propionicicella superfundia]
MYAEERRHALVEHARTEGRLSVVDAAELFGVTPETIRRDLEALDKAGLLRRVHGGAVPPELLALPERALDTRQSEFAREKERIAAAALALVPSSGTVLLDAGTTTARLAGLIPADNTATVFTNSLPAAVVLAGRSAAQVHMLGGRVRPLTHATVGNPEALGSLRVDVAFLGTNGVSERHGLSTPDWDEAAVKRAMVQCADKVVVLTDASKLGVETTVKFADLDDVDVLVTDSGARRSHLKALSAHRIEVITA